MIFQQFQSTVTVSGRVQNVTNGLWSNGSPIATQFYLLPSQTAFTGSTNLAILNGAYYYNVYDQDPTVSDTAEVQFSVAYGNVNGSGSIVDLNKGATLTTQAVYSQFKNIILDPNDPLFTFQLSGSVVSGYQSNDIYVIGFSTVRFKDQVDNGTIQFNLSGSKGNFSFIDDSSTSIQTSVGASGQVYNIINGSLVSGSINTYDSAGRGFGLFYPEIGIIVLNPVAIADKVGIELLPNEGTDQYYQNQNLLFKAIQAGGYFQARSTEFIPTSNYFVRVGNQDFNYSNNPTFVSSSNGQTNLLFPQFSTDPQVYITTVGLYDSNNNLVAVGKLSQPLLKTFDSEALIRVRLNF